PPEEQSIRAIHAALDAGVNLIDTADAYAKDESEVGHNERLIAKALKAHPEGNKVTVATKGGMARPRGSWTMEGRPAKLQAACEKSLVALGVDAITLYQLHGPDDRVPFEDSVGELARLKQEGKIRHVGLSNVTLEQLNSAQKIVRIESVQNECNPSQSEDVRTGLIRACAQQQVTYLPYSPVGGHWGHRSLAKNATLVKLANAKNTSAYCIALAWLLAQGANMVPIPGASKVTSIRDSVKAVDVQLDVADMKQITAVR
ncbi:MAG TPA: aldo/keto reductase, partial [bacterium]